MDKIKKTILTIFGLILIFSLPGCKVNENKDVNTETSTYLDQEKPEDNEIEENINENELEKPLEGDDLKSSSYDKVNNLNGITMNIKKETLSYGGVILIFENNTNDDFIYGEHFIIEKKIDGKWYEVPVTIDGNYGFNDIGYELSPGEKKELELDWKWLYGELKAFKYRIVKGIIKLESSRDSKEDYLAAEFSID